jgi:hypothetical protein
VTLEQEYSPEEKEIFLSVSMDKQEHDELMEDLSKILCTDSGRRYLWRLLSFCRVMDRSMDRDSLVMAFREGQRDIGMRLMKDIYEAEPNAYELMRKEHVKACEERKAAMDKARKQMEEDL